MGTPTWKVNAANPNIVIDFWQSLCSLSKDQNPTLNNNGNKDIVANSLRQSNSDFFYLSVNHEGPDIRECSVNSKQSIVVPSLSFLASEAERPESTIPELEAFADVDHQNINQASRRVVIDGTPVPNVDRFRVPYVDTGTFDVNYPNLNLFSARPGDSIAVADGAYLVVQGFETGPHEIHFEGIVNVPQNQDSLEYRTYFENLTYKLTIV
jgi:hypothetical protein